VPDVDASPVHVQYAGRAAIVAGFELRLEKRPPTKVS
jgi:hypothetical protein